MTFSVSSRSLLSLSAAVVALMAAGIAHAEPRMAGAADSERLPAPRHEAISQDGGAIDKVSEPKSSGNAAHDAEPAPEARDQIAQSTQAVHAIESLGTLTRSSQGGLGGSLWMDMPRSELVESLSALPVRYESPAMRDLVRRTLLTSVDSDLIYNDVPVEPGKDLLTLRLEKLTEMGAFDDALALYTRMADEPYHERLARAGVNAMLLSGKTSLACLEAKALSSRFTDQGYWSQLSGFCSLMIEKAAEVPVTALPKASPIFRDIFTKPDYRFAPETLATFDKLEIPEIGILASTGRIDYGRIASTKVEDLSPRTIATLLGDSSLPMSLRLPLSVEAVRVGVRPVQALEELYTALADDPALGGEASKDWQKLPMLYRSFRSTTDDAARLMLAKTLVRQSGLYGDTALLPFSPWLEQVTPPEASDSDFTQTIGLVLLHSGSPRAKIWLEKSLSAVPDQAAAEERAKAASLAMDLKIGIDNAAALNDLTPASGEDVSADRLQLIGIVAALDKGGQISDNPSSIYEKLLRSAPKKDYVMLPKSASQELEAGRKKGHAGYVVLGAAQALGSFNPAGLAPYDLYEVVDGLDRVGLSKTARSLAFEALTKK